MNEQINEWAVGSAEHYGIENFQCCQPLSSPAVMTTMSKQLARKAVGNNDNFQSHSALRTPLALHSYMNSTIEISWIYFRVWIEPEKI
jgi:hypothetical protein